MNESETTITISKNNMVTSKQRSSLGMFRRPQTRRLERKIAVTTGEKRGIGLAERVSVYLI